MFKLQIKSYIHLRIKRSCYVVPNVLDFYFQWGTKGDVRQDIKRHTRSLFFWRFSETKLGLDVFLKGKKSLKGSALLLSWQHCASPFLQLRVEPRVKQKIRAALIVR